MPDKLQNRLRCQKGIDDHMLDRFGRFMVVDHFMKFEPRCAKFVYLVGILDVVTNLVVQYACGVDETEGPFVRL